MYKRDYILTLIEQYSRFVARLVFLRETARYDQAYSEIDHFLKEVFGLSLDDVLKMNDEAIVAHLSEQGGADIRGMVTLADILKEAGDLYARQEREGHASRAYIRALELNLHAIGDGSYDHSFDLPAKVDALLCRMADDDIPAPIRRKLFPFLERQRRYADAEDLLFDLISSGDRSVIAEGLAFYDRLMKLGDEELERGNLPRDEVREGQKELESIANGEK